jgi:hypothetical protein
LHTQAGVAKDSGNVLGLTSTYQTTDGASHAAADVWFVADKVATDAKAQPVVSASSLAVTVSGLAQTLSTFASEGGVSPWPGSGGLNTAASGNGSTVALSVSAPPVTLAGIASALGQFDANGQPTALPMLHAAPVSAQSGPMWPEGNSTGGALAIAKA